MAAEPEGVEPAHTTPTVRNEITSPSVQGVQAGRIDNVYLTPPVRRRVWPLALAAVALLLTGFAVSQALRYGPAAETPAATATGPDPATPDDRPRATTRPPPTGPTPTRPPGRRPAECGGAAARN
ncbi:hypothetical protein ACQPZF_32790 [Actinosynnema sp. CS-041913]|uniref:hypothetical protein n=1 Tax=Actinosynnema sp. CS-041913 TaxID=3239917 RepID=UPI003D8E8244